MNNQNTMIMSFKDINNSLFTLRQGKSYNMTKCDKSCIYGKNKYCFKIVNCTSPDILVLEYNDKVLRNAEYRNLIDTYLKFNQIKESTS